MEMPVELHRDWSGTVYVLGVAEQCQRLILARFGEGWCELVEAVPGTDRYPPGRCTRIELSEEQLERLWQCWQRWREGREHGGQVGQEDEFDDDQPF